MLPVKNKLENALYSFLTGVICFRWDTLHSYIKSLNCSGQYSIPIQGEGGERCMHIQMSETNPACQFSCKV